jgi:uncharacterized protein (DUF58 family)
MTDYHKYLDPRTLNKISKLEIRARLIVEGFVSGLHKSPYHGYSVEFAEHREYVPGDEIKHIDWKVYGRTDRYYIKEYEEETNLKSFVLLDQSESMSYGSDGMTKLEYGATVAASLAYMILRQQDSVGLVLFDDEVKTLVPPSSHPSHLKYVIHALEEAEPGKKTNVGVILHDMAERIQKRGLIIVISDLFDDVRNVLMGLKHLRHRKHEVILFHLLDRDEVSFPFQRVTLFEGLEEFPHLLTDPRALRKAYLEEVAAFQKDVKKGCIRDKIDYVQITTDTLLDVALTQYLTTRMAGRRDRPGTVR